MRRCGMAAVTVLLTAGFAFGAAGCGAAGDTPGDPARQVAGEAVEVLAGLGAEGQALVAMGFDAEDVAVDELAATAEPSPGTGPAATESGAPRGQRGENWRERHRARVLLRRGMLHGEAVVRTRDGGTRTVVVQRGEVTAIDDRTVTVKSADGFTMTWSLGENLRVVERRTTIRSTEIKVGTRIGVAGAKDGDRGLARLIVVPVKQK